MFSTKAVLMAAALAMTAVVGTVPASADPYGRHLNRVENRLEHRDARIHNRITHVDRRIVRHNRRHVDRARVDYILRARHYRMVGSPYYLGPRYVVRTHDRFGRGVLVQINPWTGAFMGVIRM
jgi:hypothetical protein